jgi:hypothetical protein
MKPIFFTIDKELPIKVIPDTQMHMDGHPILTHNYNIYFDSTKNNPAAILSKGEASDNITDPDYMGAISFEKPDQLFSYTPGEHRQLTRDEIEEIIERLTEYRNQPEKWGGGN